MKNAIIECTVTNHNEGEAVLTFHSDSEMEEFFIYNETYGLIEARKIVLLQRYNKDKKEFEWV